MKRIISLQNSGESFEKAVVLYYTALESDNSFYSDNFLDIYYAHNLPKKDLSIKAHGTVGFYKQYFAKYEWCPLNDSSYLFSNREDIINELNLNGMINRKMASKLLDNQLLYEKFISKMPMEIIFSNFVDEIKQKTDRIFSNVKFHQMHLEKNFTTIYASLPNEKWAYSIYALDSRGDIDRFYFHNNWRECYYERNLYHEFEEIRRRTILSGNSAMFLAEIKEYSKHIKGAVGYREHSREKRLTRNYALEDFLKSRESIIEPKNCVMNAKFSEYFNSKLTSEQLANYVIAKCYEHFLLKYIYN